MPVPPSMGCQRLQIPAYTPIQLITRCTFQLLGPSYTPLTGRDRELRCHSDRPSSRSFQQLLNTTRCARLFVTDKRTASAHAPGYSDWNCAFGAVITSTRTKRGSTRWWSERVSGRLLNKETLSNSRVVCYTKSFGSTCLHQQKSTCKVFHSVSCCLLHYSLECPW